MGSLHLGRYVRDQQRSAGGWLTVTLCATPLVSAGAFARWLYPCRAACQKLEQELVRSDWQDNTVA